MTSTSFTLLVIAGASIGAAIILGLIWLIDGFSHNHTR